MIKFNCKVENSDKLNNIAPAINSDLEQLEWCLNNGLGNLIYARLVLKGYTSLDSLLFLSMDELNKLSKLIKLSSQESDIFIKAVLQLQETRKSMININVSGSKNNEIKSDEKDEEEDEEDDGGLDDEDEILTLKMYGQSFEISKKDAELSKFITTILEGDSDATNIEIRGFGGFNNDNNNNDDTIGLSMGGSKDVNSFRDNINNGYMPTINSISYNGLLYEYYFDTMSNRRTFNYNKNELPLFYPTYCYGSKYNKNINKYDDYLCVGLNSNIKQNEFKRKKLNLLIILDQSGSMGYKWTSKKTKMETANESIITLLSHLNDEDRFGLLSFDNDTYLHQKLQFIKDINLNQLKNTIKNIKSRGGTNFEIGYKNGIKIYNELFNDIINNKNNDIISNDEYDINDVDINNEYENRIIFITDAQPNDGLLDPESLLNLVRKYSENKVHSQRIYTTFIGVGLDFNNDLIQEITKTRGSNYFSVHSNKQFIERMDEEFEYMVTPLVFNVSLKLKSEGNTCCIKTIYGITDENKQYDMIKNGEIQKIYTLFPSKRVKKQSVKQTKGGVILIELDNHNNDDSKDNDNYNIEMEVNYEDRNGKKYYDKQQVELGINNNDNDNNDYFDNLGIRKAVLLCNYVSIIKNWINDNDKNNERKLNVTEKWKKIFSEFLMNFEKEMKICNDQELQKEIDILQTLIKI